MKDCNVTTWGGIDLPRGYCVRFHCEPSGDGTVRIARILLTRRETRGDEDVAAEYARDEVGTWRPSSRGDFEVGAVEFAAIQQFLDTGPTDAPEVQDCLKGIES